MLSGLIIAKSHSKRLKGKNMLPFNGKPMFLWNVERAVRIFEKTYVSSDSNEILLMAKKAGAIPIQRPKYLCGDTPNIPVYMHAQEKMRADIIIALQANSPTLEDVLIEQAKELMERYGFSELMTYHPDYTLYGSIWALTDERLKNYGDPYKPKPEVLLVDESIDIHTKKDFDNCGVSA